jgi:hypothetical protein
MSINQQPIPVAPVLPPVLRVAALRFVAIPATQQGRDPAREALARQQASRQQTDL